MKIEIELTDEVLMKVVHSMLENLPEYSMSMRCEGWLYEPEWIFKLVDVEDDEKKYTLTDDKMLEGFKKYLTQDTNEGPEALEWLTNRLDPSYGDAEIIDCVIQLAIFGEVIYG